MKTRYGIVYRAGGDAFFALPNQAHNHFDTRDAAQAYLDVARVHLEDRLGFKSLEVIPIECYDNGDAVRSAFLELRRIRHEKGTRWE